MSNTAVIEIKTGRRVHINELTTKNPRRTLEVMVDTGKWIWENDQVEVSLPDAVSILEAERVRLVDERAVLESDRDRFLRELAEEREHLRKNKEAFEDEKKKFELERAKYENQVAEIEYQNSRHQGEGNAQGTDKTRRGRREKA